MTKNTGRPSQILFESYFASLGKRGYCHRFTDLSDLRGLNKGKALVAEAQPSDYLVVEDGEMYCAEVKSTTGKNFSTGQIETSQRNHAKRILAAGGRYYFIIHDKQNNDWYKVPAIVFTEATKTVFHWVDLTPYRWELPYALHRRNG
jgi:hypothetical protein